VVHSGTVQKSHPVVPTVRITVLFNTVYATYFNYACTTLNVIILFGCQMGLSSHDIFPRVSLPGKVYVCVHVCMYVGRYIFIRMYASMYVCM
jgi:hypothetical protein